MEQLLAAHGEAGRAVGHHALALGRADGGAQVGLARQAGGALPAFGRVEGDHVVALLHARHTRPHVDDDARALVAEDRREQPFRIGPLRATSAPIDWVTASYLSKGIAKLAVVA